MKPASVGDFYFGRRLFHRRRIRRRSPASVGWETARTGTENSCISLTSTPTSSRTSRDSVSSAVSPASMKSRQSAVHRPREVDIARQQQLFPAGDQHNHARSDSRIVHRAAGLTAHGALIDIQLHFTAAAATKLVVAFPVKQLCRAASQGEHLLINPSENLVEISALILQWIDLLYLIDLQCIAGTVPPVSEKLASLYPASRASPVAACQSDTGRQLAYR